MTGVQGETGAGLTSQNGKGTRGETSLDFGWGMETRK